MRSALLALALLAHPAAAMAQPAPAQTEPDIDFTGADEEGPVEVIVTQDPTPLKHKSLLPDRFEYKWQREVWTTLERLRRAARR